MCVNASCIVSACACIPTFQTPAPVSTCQRIPIPPRQPDHTPICVAIATDGSCGLSVDRVIDYRCEDWWQLEEYIADPFDVIFDTVGTYESWQRANVDQGSVLTLGIEGGHYVTYTGDERYYHLHG
ncbi:hypothetical protein SARC_17332, partial [Sphaeroforma arctica JP610]